MTAALKHPSLGTTVNDIMVAFRNIDRANVGRLVTEADIVGGGMQFRWTGQGMLGVVVGEYCLRDATEAECDELEEAIELGQVQIYTKPRFVAGQINTRTVYHQSTGRPLDENSQAARRQRNRWERAYPGQPIPASQ